MQYLGNTLQNYWLCIWNNLTGHPGFLFAKVGTWMEMRRLLWLLRWQMKNVGKWTLSGRQRIQAWLDVEVDYFGGREVEEIEGMGSQKWAKLSELGRWCSLSSEERVDMGKGMNLILKMMNLKCQLKSCERQLDIWPGSQECLVWEFWFSDLWVISSSVSILSMEMIV